MRPQPPADLSALLRAAEGLVGHPLGLLAQRIGMPAPDGRAKGEIGQLIEAALGAPGGSEAGPDFGPLGVELKTLPVNARGEPRESTFVCHAPLDLRLTASWEGSRPYAKLRQVLWVPVVGEGPAAERRVGSIFLWRPDPDEMQTLAADYEEIAELVHRGEANRISARVGVALQLRPKAADSRDATWVTDADGGWMRAQPRGFYLRRRFTTAMLTRRFALV